MVLWWTIKYGGKKNIPPELIFDQMDRTMSSLKDNLMQAFRTFDEGTTQEEKDQFKSLLSKVHNLGNELNNAKNDSSERDAL